MASEASAKRHNENGEEILDNTPIQPPLGYKRTPSLYEQIQQQVRLSKLMEHDDEPETDEEADDFEIGDDFEPMSEHENDHIPSIKKLKAEAKRINDEIKEAQRKKAVDDYEKQRYNVNTGEDAKKPPPEKKEETQE